MPYTHVPKDRVYAHLAFDLESGLYAGATLNETRFVAFDEDGQPLWREQGASLSLSPSALPLLLFSPPDPLDVRAQNRA